MLTDKTEFLEERLCVGDTAAFHPSPLPDIQYLLQLLPCMEHSAIHLAK
jgi:hypothetical protein